MQDLVLRTEARIARCGRIEPYCFSSSIPCSHGEHFILILTPEGRPGISDVPPLSGFSWLPV